MYRRLYTAYHANAGAYMLRTSPATTRVPVPKQGLGIDYQKGLGADHLRVLVGTFSITLAAYTATQMGRGGEGAEAEPKAELSAFRSIDKCDRHNIDLSGVIHASQS
jgi:hypothetical protein